MRSWNTQLETCHDMPISLPPSQDSVEWCSGVETRQDQWWMTTLLEPSGQSPGRHDVFANAWHFATWVSRVTTGSAVGAVDCIWGSFRKSMMPKAYNQPENMQPTAENYWGGSVPIELMHNTNWIWKTKENWANQQLVRCCHTLQSIKHKSKAVYSVMW